MSFLEWFLGRSVTLRGVRTGASPFPREGYKYILNVGLLLHVVCGILLAVLAVKKLSEISTQVLIPLSGVTVGLTFAWAGNAQALLQTAEASAIGRETEGGLNHYAAIYQLAILLMLISLTGWALAGLGIFDSLPDIPLFIVRVFLFTLVSVSVKESWHVIDTFRLFLVSRDEIVTAKGELATAKDELAKRIKLAEEERKRLKT